MLYDETIKQWFGAVNLIDLVTGVSPTIGASAVATVESLSAASVWAKCAYFVTYGSSGDALKLCVVAAWQPDQRAAAPV